MLEEVEEGQAVPMGPSQWEYKVLVDRGRMGTVTEENLNEAGVDGWELIELFTDERRSPPEIHYFFKRPM